MTPNRAWQLAQPLADLYNGIEDDILTSIAKRLSKNMAITDTAKWEIDVLAQLGALNKDTLRIIAQRTGIAPDMLQTALETAATETIDRLEPGFETLAQTGYVKNTRIAPSTTIQRAVKAYSGQAIDTLNMVNTVMLYKTRQAWTGLIKSVKNYIDNKESELGVHSILGKHAGAVTIGAETRQQAVRKAINELIDNGIPAFVDKSGREWSPEAYVNMDIRTTVANVAHQVQFDRMDAYGVSLLAISSHAGARPKCANDQGKIYDRDNKSGFVKDLNGDTVQYYDWSSTSYGAPDGILGINCGHFITPYIPGLSMQRYFPTEDREANDLLYKQSQQQRALECKVRQSKQECMMYDVLGDKEAFGKASVKLKRRQSELDDFVESTGRTRKRDREQVVGFNRSLASRANAANNVTK